MNSATIPQVFQNIVDKFKPDEQNRTTPTVQILKPSSESKFFKEVPVTRKEAKAFAETRMSEDGSPTLSEEILAKQSKELLNP